MARLDRQRLDAADFRISTEVQTRYVDLDTQGHVNNAAAAVFLQEARGRFDHALGVDLLGAGLRPIIAALSIEYAAEMSFPEPIEVLTGVLHLGRSSLTLGHVARQGGRTTLYAETVLVLTDAQGPIPMPDAVRAAYQRARI